MYGLLLELHAIAQAAHSYELLGTSIYFSCICVGMNTLLICYASQDQLRGRSFTFWEWFYKHLDLIKSTLKREWMEG